MGTLGFRDMDGLDLDEARAVGPAARTSHEAVAAQGPVVVAIDFSADSERALLWACSYAGAIGAPLEILHVVHDPPEAPGRYRADNGDPLEPMADVARRKMVELVDRLRAEHPDGGALETATMLCTQGLPDSCILEVAQRHGAQLLVLGSRGRNGLARVLLGSTSQRVTRHAPMPVTIVKSDTRYTHA